MPDTKKYVEYFEMQDAGNVYVRDAEAHTSIDQQAQAITNLTGTVSDLDTELTGRIETLETDTAEDVADLQKQQNAMREIMKRRIKEKGTYIVAHAGNAGDAPQNSKVGILRCCLYQYDAIEFDTQITANNIPVIAHNDDLSTFTNKTGLISESIFSTINDAVITAEPYNSLYNDQEKGLPVVEDGLNIIKRNRMITPIIDIKDSYNSVDKMRALLVHVDNTNMRYETIFICDSTTKAQQLIQVDPNLSVMLVTSEISQENIDFCLDNGLIGIDCTFSGMTRASVDLAHAAGLIVGGWTIYESNVNSVNTYRNMIPDMYTVWSPGFFANGGNYGAVSAGYSTLLNAYRKSGKYIGITPFDWNQMIQGSFTWHTSSGSAKFPDNCNFALLNRALLFKKIPAANGNVIKVSGGSDYMYQAVMYDASGTKLGSSAWSATNITVNQANTAFVVLEGRRADNASLTVIDLENLSIGCAY